MPLSPIVATGDLLVIGIDGVEMIVPTVLEPIPLTGTSPTVRVAGRPACIEGDELPPWLSVPLEYFTPVYQIPGMGRLSLILNPGNLSQSTTNSGTLLLLMGEPFEVSFEVEAPALMPTPAGTVPDPVPVKMTAGCFLSATRQCSAS